MAVRIERHEGVAEVEIDRRLRDPQVLRAPFGIEAGNGVLVGDRVIDMRNAATTGSEASSFESTISIAGQLQQTSASNLSANEYWAITIG